MTEIEAIKKAIRHFECMKNDAVVVLDSGFGTHPGESDLVYRNRKMYAELAIQALEKHIPKKPNDEIKTIPVIDEDGAYVDADTYVYLLCPICGNQVGIDNCIDNYCSCCGQKMDRSDEE